MGPPMHAPMSMARLAVFAAAVLAILVFPLLAETPIERTWNEEHAELLEQIGRLKESDVKWRDRLAAEALDQQALILPTDKDPLDVVLRRTAALVHHFKSRKMLSESVLSGFETQWHELSTAAQSTSEADARRKLYIQACGLRRVIALANPRLDFDHIVCMLEQPGDGRIMEQARAVYPGHNKGGGPIIIQNFTSESVRAQLLAGVRVTSGPWQGKELTGKFSGLELNYNGKELLFAATTVSPDDGASPRLVFTKLDLPALRQRVTTSEYASIWEDIRQSARSYCDPNHADYADPDNLFTPGEKSEQMSQSRHKRLLVHGIGRMVSGRMEAIGLTYQITGDADLGRHGAALLTAFCERFPVTDPTVASGFAGGRGDIMMGLALGVDWLGECLTTEQRKVVTKACAEYVEQFLREFNNPEVWFYRVHNYNGVNGGAAGCLALNVREADGREGRKSNRAPGRRRSSGSRGPQ